MIMKKKEEETIKDLFIKIQRLFITIWVILCILLVPFLYNIIPYESLAIFTPIFILFFLGYYFEVKYFRPMEQKIFR